jgi:hypothetical protein
LRKEVEKLEGALRVSLKKQGLSDEAIEGLWKGELAKRVKKEYVTED